MVKKIPKGDERYLRSARIRQTDGQIGIDRAEIVRHPHKHLVTRSIGTHPDVEVDLRSADCREGDLYLLCSDGLTDVLGDGEIGRILAGPDASPEDSCRRLVRSANEAGGPDNITAVVVRILTGT